jgi:hypothetical protein
VVACRASAGQCFRPGTSEITQRLYQPFLMKMQVSRELRPDIGRT